VPLPEQPLLFGQTSVVEPSILFAPRSFAESTIVVFRATQLYVLQDAPPPPVPVAGQDRSMRPMAPMFIVSFPDKHEMVKAYCMMVIPVDLRS
jgi:hypothetical protein